jgi:hypothetical protein
MALLPSINFSLYSAEIFPWGFIFGMLFLKKIDKPLIIIGVIYLGFSIYGFFSPNAGSSFEFFRSLGAYVNVLVVFYTLTQLPDETVSLLSKVTAYVFVGLLFFGVLQYFQLINFLESFIQFLIARGTVVPLGGAGRGISLLSSEPARASIEVIFMYLLVRFTFINEKYRWITDLLILCYIAFFIRATTGIALMLILVGLMYFRKRFIPFLILGFITLVIVVPLIETDIRGIVAFQNILSARSFDQFFSILERESGFRVVSILSAYKYGILYPFGGGIGTWQTTMITAFEQSGFNPEEIAFTVSCCNGDWMAVRPNSFFGVAFIDGGLILGLSILGYIYFTIDNVIEKYTPDMMVISLFFILVLFIILTAGNPVPWMMTMLVLRQLGLKNKILENQRT